MPARIDLTGQKFGRLTALYPVPNNNYRTRWHCICDCGNTKDVLQQSLCNGHVRSCGCYRIERDKEKISALNASMNRESHNETKTRLYRIWIGIKSRCFDKNHSSYKKYGYRGITMCDEWRISFLSFKEWSISNGYSDSLSIDRIDVNGNYSPDNCRWVSNSVQQFNKRRTSRNTSGHVGVSWNKNSRRWIAYITKNGETTVLGYFVNYNDAVIARENAEAQFFG